MSDQELNASKLREQVLGLDPGADEIRPHAVVAPDDDLAALDFVDSALDGHFAGTDLGEELHRSLHTRAAQEAVRNGEGATLAYLTGLAEREVGADSITVLTQLQECIRNNGAPMNLIVGGLPETGKSNSSFLISRIWEADNPEGSIVTNVRSLAIADHHVTSMTELMEYLTRPAVLEERTLLIIDEGSTHFDARRNRREVEMQWSPLAKRFAKLSVDVITIGHTLTDLHPEALRLGTLFAFKGEKRSLELYGSLDPSDREFADPVAMIEPIEEFPARWYDPDDWSPWQWDLDAGLLDRENVEAVRDGLDRGPD